MQEDCKYGERCLRLDCKYVHNIKKRNVPCVHFQSNKCFKGDRCPYMHVLKMAPKPSVPSLSMDIVPAIVPDIVFPIIKSSDLSDINKEMLDDISDHLDIDDNAATNAKDVEIRTEKLLESAYAEQHPDSDPSLSHPEDIHNKMDIDTKEPDTQLITEESKKEEQTSEKTQNIEETEEKSKENSENTEKNEIIDGKNSDVSFIEDKKAEEDCEKNKNPGNVEQDSLDKTETQPIMQEKVVEPESKSQKNTEEKLLKVNEKVQEEVNLKRSPNNIELKNDSKKTPLKSNEIALPVVKPQETLIKVIPPTKTQPEKATVPLVKLDEKVTLPPARKTSGLEKTTRIMTLEEIKQKKKLDALMKGEQKEVSEPKPANKLSPNPNPIPKHPEFSVKLPEFQAKPSEIPAKPLEIPAKPSEIPAKPSEIPAKPSETPKLSQDLPIKPSEIPLKPSEIPSKPTENLTKTIHLSKNPPKYNPDPIHPTDIIQLPSKRPASSSNPPQKHPNIEKLPLLVTSEEWEPYKQILLTLDFSNFSLPPEDIQGCKTLASLISTPEGISKVAHELEQKLLNFPDIQPDPEFEAMSLVDRIDKLYENLKFY